MAKPTWLKYRTDCVKHYINHAYKERYKVTRDHNQRFQTQKRATQIEESDVIRGNC
jgi:hypothetical protein